MIQNTYDGYLVGDAQNPISLAFGQSSASISFKITLFLMSEVSLLSESDLVACPKFGAFVILIAEG